MPRLLCFAVLAIVLAVPQTSRAQVGGVYIDAKGMLRQTSALSPDDRLKLLRAQAVGEPNSKPLAAGSSLRKVSLKQLEKTVSAAMKSPRVASRVEKLPPEIRYLAGLTRIQYVFFDPVHDDVILAGPAEGWKQLETGEVVGVKTGRPVLHLEDLIAALRYAFDEKQRSFIGCSIDPTQEGLKRYAAAMRNLGRIDRRRIKQTFAGLERAMGPQTVRILGVEPGSRFALSLLAADYRLKRIAMGHDRSPVPGVASYLDIAAKGRLSSRQPQHRWWFVAEYDAIHHTTDKLAWELVGQGVKVQTARALTKETKNGRKPKVAPAAKKFTAAYTKHFPDLAKKMPVFAELQNLISLSVAAELVAARHYGEVSTKSTDWKPKLFLNPKACVVPQYPVPKTVPAIASYRLVRGRQWLISVSGGVEINPRSLAKTATKASADSDLGEVSAAVRRGKPDKWWWD